MPHLWPPATYIDECAPPLTFQALAARTTTPAARPAPRGAPTHRRQRSHATRWGGASLRAADPHATLLAAGHVHRRRRPPAHVSSPCCPHHHTGHPSRTPWGTHTPPTTQPCDKMGGGLMAPAGHLEVTHSPHRIRRGQHEGMGPQKLSHECSWGSHQYDPPPRGPTRPKRPGAPFSSEASNGGPMDGRPTSFKPAVTATLHAPHSRLTARKWVHIWVSHGRTSKRRAPTRSPTQGCRGEKLCRETRWWVAG